LLPMYKTKDPKLRVFCFIHLLFDMDMKNLCSDDHKDKMEIVITLSMNKFLGITAALNMKQRFTM